MFGLTKENWSLEILSKRLMTQKIHGWDAGTYWYFGGKSKKLYTLPNITTKAYRWIWQDKNLIFNHNNLPQDLKYSLRGKRSSRGGKQMSSDEKRKPAPLGFSWMPDDRFLCHGKPISHCLVLLLTKCNSTVLQTSREHGAFLKKYKSHQRADYWKFQAAR